jgi:hypothetical protein
VSAGSAHATAVGSAGKGRRVDALAWRPVIAAAAIAGGGRAVGLPWWASAVGAVYVVSVASSATAMRETYAAWQEQSQAWSQRLQDGEVGQALHDMTGGARQDAARAVEVLERHDAPAGRDARDRLDVMHERVKRQLQPFTTPQGDSVWQAHIEGYLGGRRFIELPGSPKLVRYFAVYENTPAWLPRAVRRRAVPVLRLIDVVRLLHNEDVERRALIATLWVRVAVVAVAPLTASASLTGLVPLRAGSSSVVTVVYAAAVAAAMLAALRGPRIATYTMHQPTRWRLYSGEQALAIAAVVVAPCWAVAVYGAGAVNWLQRPDWTLRKLFGWMAITYVPFAASAIAQGADAERVAAEAAIAIAVTAIIAGSYGLMAPVTAATLVRALVDSVAWRVRVWGVLRGERRELRDIISDVESGLLAHAAHSAEAADAAERARAAREQLAGPRVSLARRPRRLDRLLEATLARAVVPDHAELPEGVPEPQLLSAPVVFQPVPLAQLTVESGGNARRLDRLVTRIVGEAVDKGATGLIRTYVRRAPDGAVDIEIANAVPERPLSGFGTGAQWLERDCLAIPGAEIVTRGRWTSDHPDATGDVYCVVVRLGPTIFERGV